MNILAAVHFAQYFSFAIIQSQNNPTVKVILKIPCHALHWCKFHALHWQTSESPDPLILSLMIVNGF